MDILKGRLIQQWIGERRNADGIFIDKWSPALQIRTVLLSIQALLSAPNPDDPLATDVAKHYKTDEKDAQRVSREWTQQYGECAIPFRQAVLTHIGSFVQLSRLCGGGGAADVRAEMGFRNLSSFCVLLPPQSCDPETHHSLKC